ncbi:MAG: class I SAM-dependent methyltransferase [Spirochaetia bacterium]|nr:class I SAM-dependent methyltransferase [Spirochaetia bacterium]
MNKKYQIKKPEDYYTSGEYFNSHKDSCSDIKIDLVIPFLKKNKIDVKQNTKIIEVGCGSGEFLMPLTKFLESKNIQYKIKGYDISKPAIDMANKKNKYKNLMFYVGSVKNIKEKTDLIFCMDVIEHVENPFEFLRSLNGKSKYIVLHLPIEHSIGHLLLEKTQKSNETFKHIHFFSLQTALILIKELPFEILDYQFTAASMAAIKIKGNIFIRFLRVIRFFMYKISSKFSSIMGGGSVLFLLKNKK